MVRARGFSRKPQNPTSRPKPAGDIYRKTSRFLSHDTSYTPIRHVRRPNDERNAPAKSNENATCSTETQSEVGPSDGYGDYDGYGYYEGCGGCGDYDDGCDDCDDSDVCDDFDFDSGGTAARTEKGSKRYPASTAHNAKHESR